ncbi:hypothetical protein PoB_005465000 [Plakobranchus ocellatus]|uniref:HAT C-terminal dimerisation domain-containing protein n=1 Tax=Plakobranchus ocellatus TaxID=259542 RepID=A0AAV4C8Z0_9GAST|nr:hypothetical protein PoB_005465000 [Plakobranchus ocellatus]
MWKCVIFQGAWKMGMSAKLRAMLERFPSITEQCTRDVVLHQFASLQCSDLEIHQSSRVDHAWAKLLSSEYKDLAKVMLKILTHPHSSAHCERIFSCVRRNPTDFRSSLEEETLEAILVTKLLPGSCLDKDRQHNASMLKHLKGSCM